MINPFQLTRAADLDDRQIAELWVDPEGDLGKRLRPASQLPLIILGGKGSGKTHLMRYYSYAIQRFQHGSANMQKRVADSGYIGVYARCSGLNAARFSQKKLTSEQWHDVFGFYMELWLGQLILQTACEFIADCNALGTFSESTLILELRDLFDAPPSAEIRNLEDFSRILRQLQRDLDCAVNNAGFGTPLIPRIAVTSGRLIFGLPQALTRVVPCLKNLLFTLLIDEYENLYQDAQQHVNTLIRERENPVTFKIGARLYGMRTFKTFSGDEELRQGSEYELLNLDQELRGEERAYEEFALKLCVSRIRFTLNGGLPEGWTEGNAQQKLEECFEESRPIAERLTDRLKSRDDIAPWLSKLTRHLLGAQRDVYGLGLRNEVDIRECISMLNFKQDPLIEKTNTFLFYRAWSDRANLKDAARQICESAGTFAMNPKAESDHARVLDKFKDDMCMQMLRDFQILELEMLQSYTGFRTWIEMSNGIVRNLIITLKHVFDWASFHEEKPLTAGGISLRSQVKALRDAANWFVNDASVVGGDRTAVRASVTRIATLLSALRFSEKPPECSLSSFSVDKDSLDEAATRILEAAEKWSLFIRISDRTDRNTEMEVPKYRINGLIAPKYDLPIYTRGNIHLSTEESSAIFAKGDEVEFARILSVRVARAQPPFRLRDDQPKPERTEAFSDELGLF